MAKVIAICGKICCGKTYYSNMIKAKDNYVVLSCDEITSMLFDNNLGDKHDEITQRIKQYLLTKSIDVVNANCNVILDWGFWTKNERQNIRQYFQSMNIEFEMHFINITNNAWERNIDERNSKIINGEDKSNYYLDEGLINKLLSLWESPTKDEIDIWYHLDRE